MNPPGHPPLALDFVAVDEYKRPYPGRLLLRHLFYRLPVQQTYAWAKPVYAPCEGVVATALDGCEDRHSLSLLCDLATGLIFRPRRIDADFRPFGGNHVVLQTAFGYCLMAHLRQGSVAVAPGEHVGVGQVLAEVGNSGSSIQPHLHFQLMREPDPFSANLIPFRFSRYERRLGGTWTEARQATPTNGECFRILDNLI
jgi:murein DD-endopeptidase MepM/ murein hydrolase activator NlpD